MRAQQGGAGEGDASPRNDLRRELAALRAQMEKVEGMLRAQGEKQAGDAL